VGDGGCGLVGDGGGPGKGGGVAVTVAAGAKAAVAVGFRFVAFDASDSRRVSVAVRLGGA
jgi:hypothetical protein